MDVVEVSIEIDFQNRLPSIAFIGLSPSVARELGWAIRDAIQAAGYPWPRKRILVNVTSPNGPVSDPFALGLPIAVAILVANGDVTPTVDLDKIALMGELSLTASWYSTWSVDGANTGNIRQRRGVVAAAQWASQNGRQLVTSLSDGRWAGRLPGVATANTLREVCAFLEGGHLQVQESFQTNQLAPEQDDLRMKFTEATLRALLVACTGRHPLLLLGQPGTHKSSLARRAARCLPPLTSGEADEVMRVQDLAGLYDRAPARPFRAPHHSVSDDGMLGRGRPGEVLLAKHGVLLIDEVDEFRYNCLTQAQRALQPDTQIIYAASPPANDEMAPLVWRNIKRNAVGAEVAIRMDDASDGAFHPGPAIWETMRTLLVAARRRLESEPVIITPEAVELLAACAPSVADVAKTIAALSSSGVLGVEHVHEAVSLSLDTVLSA